jgi:hypothetical protein
LAKYKKSDKSTKKIETKHKQSGQEILMKGRKRETDIKTENDRET